MTAGAELEGQGEWVKTAPRGPRGNTFKLLKLRGKTRELRGKLDTMGVAVIGAGTEIAVLEIDRAQEVARVRLPDESEYYVPLNALKRALRS